LIGHRLVEIKLVYESCFPVALLTTGEGFGLAPVMDTILSLMKLMRAARTLTGASQDELAQEAGVSRQIIVRIEAADETVTVDAVEKVRAALERKAVIFIPSTAERGPGVALSK